MAGVIELISDRISFIFQLRDIDSMLKLLAVSSNVTRRLQQSNPNTPVW